MNEEEAFLLAEKAIPDLFSVSHQVYRLNTGEVQHHYFVRSQNKEGRIFEGGGFTWEEAIQNHLNIWATPYNYADIVAFAIKGKPRK